MFDYLSLPSADMNVNVVNIDRRWMVLTPTGIYSFKTKDDYKSPTESIPLKDCNTIKSAEDEIHKENSFVNHISDSSIETRLLEQ